VEDFEDKSAGELNGQGGWIADSQDGVVVGPPAPGDTGGSVAAAAVRGAGNTTDKQNCRIAEKACPPQGWKDTDTVFVGAKIGTLPSAFNMPAWETNVGFRVPRDGDTPLTVHHFANPLGPSPQFGTERPESREATSLRLRLTHVERPSRFREASHSAPHRTLRGIKIAFP